MVFDRKHDDSRLHVSSDSLLDSIMLNDSRLRDYRPEADSVVSIKRTALSVFGLHAQPRQYPRKLWDSLCGLWEYLSDRALYHPSRDIDTLSFVSW